MAGQAGFGKDKRLLNANDYGRVFDSPDARASNKLMMLLSRRNSLGKHRIGLVIAKKNVRLAVDRNRIKRIAREFVRKLPANQINRDIVLLARRGLGELDNEEVSSILQQLWLKLIRHDSSDKLEEKLEDNPKNRPEGIDDGQNDNRDC